MTRAHLAYDLHREVAVDAPVDRLGVDLGVDAFGQTGHHGAVDGRESHIAVAEGLHVRLDAAVHSGRMYRAAGCIDRDAAIDGVGIDGPVGVANPDALRRLDLPVVVPFGADVAAAAEEVAAFAVAPIHVAERAQRAQAGRQMVFDVASDASEEQPDADDDAEEHAAANDLATPRAPETLDGCGLIQGHVHGHRCYGPSISQVSPRRATARRG